MMTLDAIKAPILHCFYQNFEGYGDLGILLLAKLDLI
jgi:hypothetical protein